MAAATCALIRKPNAKDGLIKDVFGALPQPPPKDSVLWNPQYFFSCYKPFGAA